MVPPARLSSFSPTLSLPLPAALTPSLCVSPSYYNQKGPKHLQNPENSGWIHRAGCGDGNGLQGSTVFHFSSLLVPRTSPNGLNEVARTPWR
ncbi:hypothetical protein E2C01_089934 [Portunus trituberculatus]|uniref:Uncharacterized protein n=1 Tax=Portunus trituberculatus TaxID=210409 RepID=A0A5B7JA56_PORTR|nr:hypothetical protein [Portunus trituberculatus]